MLHLIQSLLEMAEGASPLVGELQVLSHHVHHLHDVRLAGGLNQIILERVFKRM